ncbi:hypothetical protein OIN60_21185 [Paenibacillus sp. P96]|uniref:DUF975 family protein n=1 Tax=Paenibacillus zeirhizosphaerae TaxID=2987519 RepID=A0ABT9FWY3_9BACL|nr:hypothetical protein [Paenibacillus sp. P96]MDP4099235.1 hypothetical protein [Paenibacillus sp. P96]
MIHSVKEGWTLVRLHFFIVILLFIYRLVWGVFNYKYTEAGVVPLLLRYPGNGQSELNQTLFWMESQIALVQSSTVHLYLWVLLAVIVLRMLLTPLIRAGMYYSLHVKRQHGRRSFLIGIRLFWRSSLFYYAVEVLLLLLPGYWILPHLLQTLSDSLQEPLNAVVRLLPYLALWGIWAWLIRQSVMYMQFGTVSGRGAWFSLACCMRRIPPGIGISVMLGAAVVVLFSVFAASAWVWTGMLALILHQIYCFISSLCKIWHTSAQYHLWNTACDSFSKE